MQKLYFYFRERTTKNGKKIKIPYTTQFGFNMSISLNGNIQIHKDPDNGLLFIYYNPYYAEIKVNEKGFLVLSIIDENSFNNL